ncbi:hypothetical protein BU16DRAFT_144198 [Lophium mytilinum]|uniref:non-specific serine/threonine protein kinase n=1 Tax=Lophium mytilinum TaxID=390894 RepID=A0A6A6QG79_9PEZI|nr:hypothetical protein BU16DRAFT_144198 [Lophium mytilinum]
MNPPSFSSPSERLSTFFSAQHEGRAYTDLEIQQISHLLVHLQESWSRYPRTYIVLRTIRELALLNQLIDLGFTDHWFPVEVRSLPQSLSPSIRSAFVKAQSLVLTKSIDLEKGESGRHGHFSKDEPLPFEIKGKLGSGGFSQVDRVLSLISYKEYALKRTRRRVAFGNDTREAFKRFKAEVEIIKYLKHRHMIEFVGSYTDPVFLGILMSPVADTDLAKYLKGIASSTFAGLPPVEDLTNLRSYFGCLANALQYLHEQSIRHKDIKPQNILIESGNVLFTDFGLSRNFQDATGSTTSGMTYMTPRYSAPEVAAYDARNTSADIWSLGCVFLEMTLTLKGLDLSYMNEFFESTGSRDPYVNCNPEATAKLIAQLSVTEPLLDNEPLDWIKSMLIRDRHLRPTAAQVFTSIVDRHHFNGLSTTFCGICCLATDESDSHDSLYEEFNTDSNGTGSSFPAISSHSAEETVQPSTYQQGPASNSRQKEHKRSSTISEMLGNESLFSRKPAAKDQGHEEQQSSYPPSSGFTDAVLRTLNEAPTKEPDGVKVDPQSTSLKSKEEHNDPSPFTAISTPPPPGNMPPSPPLNEKTPDAKSTFTSEVSSKRPSIPLQLNTDESGHDQESDKLREETISGMRPPREALPLPSEFDSYWADFAANTHPQEKKRECAICAESCPIPDLPSLMNCEHEPQVCSDCYQRWIASELNSKSWKEIKCPEEGCKQILCHAEVQEYATSEVYAKFDALSAREALNKLSKVDPDTGADNMMSAFLRTRTPSPPGGYKSTIVRSTSNASASADSVRKFGGIRRNVSVSSKFSSRPSSPVASSFATPSAPPAIHRSNTVPSKRSPANNLFSRNQQASVPAPVLVQSVATQRPPETAEETPSPDRAFQTVKVPRKPVKRYQLSDTLDEGRNTYYDNWELESRYRLSDSKGSSSGMLQYTELESPSQSQWTLPVVSNPTSSASDVNPFSEPKSSKPKSKKKDNRLLRLFSPKPRGEKPVSPQQTPETPRRDLASWWKTFEKRPDAKSTEGRVFGVPLRTMIPYANVAISLCNEDGESFIYGYVPIVLAKCGVFLKEKGIYPL